MSGSGTLTTATFLPPLRATHCAQRPQRLQPHAVIENH
jgi:hypothetical protein